MSLFQCYECGCRENTATSNFWARQEGPWRGLPSHPWMICSACDPDIGGWHGKFEWVYLAKGEFVTDLRGNLVHKDSANSEQQQEG